MPHININHFPKDLDEKVKAELVESISNLIKTTFECDDSAISVVVKPVSPENWQKEVYEPQIVDNIKWLVRKPQYGALAKL